jgi:hypothetical protein
MNEEAIRKTLEEGASLLFARQPNIFDFTPQTGQTEWNLAHHLAMEIHKFFPRFDCDLDVVKPDYDNRRPDIIIHERGTHAFNLLVVEVKRDGTDAALRADAERIHEHWFREPLRYQFGAIFNLRSNRSAEVEVFKNPQ